MELTDQDLLNDINKFITDLYLLKGLRIKRVCLKANANLRRLVVFADASQRVYSACCYLIGRSDADDENPSCHLFFTNRVTKDWNDLPPMVKEAPSVNSFKNLYDEHIGL